VRDPNFIEKESLMRSKITTLALVAGLAIALSGTAFAKGSGSKQHVAVGTITSMDSNQVVINEKVKGKDQPMTFKLDSSTIKTGNLANGSTVTIHYRTDKNENVATAVRERKVRTAKTSLQAEKSLTKS
jgi:hypothetical protein